MKWFWFLGKKHRDQPVQPKPKKDWDTLPPDFFDKDYLPREFAEAFEDGRAHVWQRDENGEWKEARFDAAPDERAD